MSRIVLLGAGGQVGQEISVLQSAIGLDIAALCRLECDIAKPKDIAAVFERIRPQIVINAAAMTAVDLAESQQDLAMLINRDGPAHLARACLDQGAALIHLSTDYVFGEAPGRPLVESDPVAPLNFYGRSKAAGEEAIRAILPRHIILRTSWIYGSNGTNFFQNIMRLAETRPSLNVVSDEQSCPTFAPDLATAICQIAARIAGEDVEWGTYHACGQDGVTRLEFAQIIMAARQASDLRVADIFPTTQAAFNAPAIRPKDSRMDCNALKADYGIVLPGVRDRLPPLVKKLYSSDANEK